MSVETDLAAALEVFTGATAGWRTGVSQYRDWLAGTATGGPNSDGRYPMIDSSGGEYLLACPAKIYADALAISVLATGNVAKATKAALDPGDLNHAAGVVGLVYNDGANNGYYVKVGASGTGSWTFTGFTLATTVTLGVLASEVLARMFKAGVDLDAVYATDGVRKAWGVRPDGTVGVGKIDVFSLLADKLRTPALTVESAVGATAATLYQADLHADVAWAVLAAKAIALSIDKNGLVEARKARVDQLYSDFSRSGRLEIESVHGALVATLRSLADLSGDNAAWSVVDTNKQMAIQVESDGNVWTKFDHVGPYVGAKFQSNGSYLVEARRRPGSVFGRHDLFSINLTTGVEVQLTSDVTDKIDYLNPAIVGTYCVFTKRIGEALQKAAVPLSGGAAVPYIAERSLHMLGDSFVHPEIMTAILGACTDKARASTMDGVGGSSLADQKTRLAATPRYLDRTLIIVDGGLSDADPITQLGLIAGTLTPAIKRWVYMQSGIDSTTAPAAVTAKLANDALIAAAFPNNYCDTYNYMRANGTGSAVGSNGGQVWPADVYGDTLHPNTYGRGLLGACLGAFINAKGW